MKVKAKDLLFSSLPNKKSKKKLLKADQGFQNPGDPRIKNMIKTLPDDYFDIFGGQPQHTNTPDIQPIGATAPNTGSILPNGIPTANPSGNLTNQQTYKPPIQKRNQGNPLLLGLAAIDAAIPGENIQKQNVIRPEEHQVYNQHPYGTGSQALADGGQVGDPNQTRKPIRTNDPNDRRLRAYNDSLNLHNIGKEATNVLRNPSTTSKQWRDYRNPESKKEDSYVDDLSKMGKKDDWTSIYKKAIADGVSTFATGYDKPVQPYVYKPNDPKRSEVQAPGNLAGNISQIGAPTGGPGPLAGGPTNFSFTGRDNQGQQTSRYFPDLGSWQNAIDNQGYRWSDVTNNGKEAHASGYQFYTGGQLMSNNRTTPIVIPEGTEDNMPSARDGHWIQKAINPKHKGYCTPMTKSTCTPKRKALAKTFKKHHGFHKGEDGTYIPDMAGETEGMSYQGPESQFVAPEAFIPYEGMPYGGIIPDNMSNFSPHRYEQGGNVPQFDILEQYIKYHNGGILPDMLGHIVHHPDQADMQGFADGGEIPDGGGKEPKYKPNGPVYNMGSYGPNWAAPLTKSDSTNYLRDYNEARQNPSAAVMKINHINHIAERNQWLEDVYGPKHTWEGRQKKDNEQISAAIESYKPITNAQENYLNAYEDANTPGTMTLNLPPDTKKPKKKQQGGSIRGGSDTKNIFEQIVMHPSMDDMKGWAKNGKTLSKKKAGEILHDGTAHGKKITDKQRRYFGAVASGYADLGTNIGDPTTPFTNKNIDNSHTKLAKDAQFVDTLNYVLASGNNPKGGINGYTPDQKSLVQSAYLWKKQNAGKSPEEVIQSYYNRPVTTGNTTDQLRQSLGKIGYSPNAMYNTSPTVELQQRQQSTPLAIPDDYSKNVAKADIEMKNGGIMYDDGGTVDTMWGGDVQPISNNPYDGGTLQFKGASHENGGIGMHYNGQPVEVEGGETASKDKEGNLTVFGNMHLPGTRTKFKDVVKEMGQKEKSYQRLKSTGAQLVNQSNPANRFEQLSFNAGKVMMSGGDMGQKDLAQKKDNLANLQKSMLDTSKEYGIDPHEMSKGNVKKAKKGIKIAAEGDQIGDPNDPTRSDRNKNPGNIKYGKFAKANGATGQDKDGFAIFSDKETGKRAMVNLLESDNYANLPVSKAISKWTDNKPYRYELGDLANKSVSDLSPDEFNKVIDTMTKGEGTRYGTPTRATPPPVQPVQPFTPYHVPNVPISPDTPQPITPKGATPPPVDHLDVPGRPTIPTNAEPLHLNEVLGEIYAAATNKQEPVVAQKYTPEQYVPYQVSFQDRLNQNENTFNSLRRMVGSGNSATALGTLAASKYNADDSVKADEFRTNQGISNDITNKNIGLENDAQLKNLAIADQQYVRQSTAKSKTKEQNQMILNSISGKYAQNDLNNKRLKAYENLYDYRFVPTQGGGDVATYFGPNAAFNFNNDEAAARNSSRYDRTTTRTDQYGNVKSVTNYKDDELKQRKLELETEMQRRKLPLLSAPELFWGGHLDMK